MLTCQQIQELIPWYVTGRLSLDESEQVAAHLATCDACRKEFAEAARLRTGLATQAEGHSIPPDAWETIAGKAGLTPTARIDLGSFLLGLKLGTTQGRKRSSVQGNLTVCGRKIRFRGRDRKGA